MMIISLSMNRYVEHILWRGMSYSQKRMSCYWRCDRVGFFHRFNTANLTTNNKTCPLPPEKHSAQITSNQVLSSIMQKFPSGIDYAFGYGSAVIHQHNSNSSSSMIDIIVAVSEPLQWHTANLHRNSSHYSLLARFGGPKLIAWLQDGFGAKLYFHPYIDMEIENLAEGNHEISRYYCMLGGEQNVKRKIKYGIVSTDSLISDLRNWDYLYIAGRMQKPIVQIDLFSPCSSGEHESKRERFASERSSRKDEIENAQQMNLLGAVSTSLLLILGNERLIPSVNPTSSKTILSPQKLYETIASLSYTGDFRMNTGAEDPDKVAKLVATPGMIDLWEKMYYETFLHLQNLHVLKLVTISDDTGDISEPHNKNRIKHIELNLVDEGLIKQLMTHLPSRIRKYIDENSPKECTSIECIVKKSFIIRKAITGIVAPAARSQGLKGILTAGISKSWKYALAKLAKGRIKTNTK